MSALLDILETNPFIDGPAELLSAFIADELKNVKQFAGIFEFIDGYKRMDYGFDNLPAIRIYNERYRKDFESWFIGGDLTMDILLPAYIDRDENHKIPDILTAAVVQQFRRPSFFTSIRAKVPGLNELGKTVDVDKSLAFVIDDDMVPLTRVTLNFKIDLREWDAYLISTGRTKDSPFEVVLGSLDKITFQIQGLKELNINKPDVIIDTSVKL